MSSKEYIEQAIKGEYLSIPIKKSNEFDISNAAKNALRKSYLQFRKMMGSDIHTCHKRFNYYDDINNILCAVIFYRYHYVEAIYIKPIGLTEEEEKECKILLETGKQYNLDWGTEYSYSYAPADIEFPDDFSISIDFLGYLSKAMKFTIPTTPETKTCDGEEYIDNPWGNSGGTLVEGDSRVITCPFCTRTETP